MPGFTTHYLFGLNTYKQLKQPEIKKTIFEHHAAFSLGLQGPDVFFYYLPSYALHENNIGSVAHIEDTNKFFRYLLESRNLFPDKKENQIAQAYIMGFLGHYLLDCQCHPYVYFRTCYQGSKPDYFGSHMNLEADIDAELLSFYKQKQPSAFRPESTILLTRLEVRTIATILYYVYSMTYPQLNISYTTMRLAIRSMQLGLRLLQDPHRKKKVLVRKIEALTLGYPVLSPMIPSDYLHFYPDPLNVLRREWKNPWDTSQSFTNSFFDLINQAQMRYLSLLPLLYRLFGTPNHSDAQKARMHRILNRIGNNSYHSGLSVEVELPH